MTSSAVSVSAPSPTSRKSADAFRTISEVAETLKLPQHVLRFWETRFTQIKPLKRAGGRRFYRPEDVELLGAIRLLLYGEGYTIKGVQRILREQGPRAVAALAQRRGTEADGPVLLAVPDEAAGDLQEVMVGDEAVFLAAVPGEALDIDHDSIVLLEAALAELAECRRILVAAQP